LTQNQGVNGPTSGKSANVVEDVEMKDETSGSTIGQTNCVCQKVDATLNTP
jgi:hypothetical protein